MATSPSAQNLLQTSQQRTRDLFGDISVSAIEANEQAGHRARLASKIYNDYRHSTELPAFLAQKHGKAKQAIQPSTTPTTNGAKQIKMIEDTRYVPRLGKQTYLYSRNQPSGALTVRTPLSQTNGAGAAGSGPRPQSSSLVRRENYQPIKPEWHAPWKLRTVLR
jgi:pleiotropic regulator 1